MTDDPLKCTEEEAARPPVCRSYLFLRQLGITFVCEGYRWRQMTRNIIDMLLWRRGEDPENNPSDENEDGCTYNDD